MSTSIAVKSKVCTKCHKRKLAKFFSARPDRPIGIYPSCKKCKAASHALQNRQKRAADPISSWVRNAYQWAKWRCKNTAIVFSLSTEDIRVKLGDRACAYCGITFNFTRTIKTRRDSPTIDRIVCCDGYTVSNTVICCFRCNAIKSDATPYELRMIADAVDALTRT